MSEPASRGAKVTWTYEDYRQMPDDGLRYEVIDGDRVVTPAPTTTHQKVSKRIQLALMLQVEERGLGQVFNAPVDVIFSSTRTVQPDLLVVCPERADRISERGIEGAPDLVVEILSPHTSANDRGRKRKLYAEEGVREYWIADPEARTVEVLTAEAAGFRSQGTFGPGGAVSSTLFSLDLAIDSVFRP